MKGTPMRSRHHALARAAMALLVAASLFVPAPYAAAQEKPAEAPAPTSSDTPAGRQFAAWLAAFNGGDRAALRRFLADQLEPLPTGPAPADVIADRQFGMFTS